MTGFVFHTRNSKQNERDTDLIVCAVTCRARLSFVTQSNFKSIVRASAWLLWRRSFPFGSFSTKRYCVYSNCEQKHPIISYKKCFPRTWYTTSADTVIVETLRVIQLNKERPIMFRASFCSFCPETDKSSSHPHTEQFRININIILLANSDLSAAQSIVSRNTGCAIPVRSSCR
jgi:hypothetical protein